MLPIKKLYIDSRHRTEDSESSSNFKIELPYSITLPDNTVFFVTDISIPHVFKLIEAGLNDRIYYYYSWRSDSTPITEMYTYITLPSGNYTGSTLASQLQSLMNGNIYTGANISFTVSYDSGNNSISISCSGTETQWRFITDAELQYTYIRLMLGNSIDPAHARSASDILSVHSTSDMFRSGEVYNCEFMNIHPINNIYITSPNLGSFDTLSPFSNNVIKKVPINVPYGYMIIDQNSTNNDFLNCSKQTIRTIEFHLKDSRGRYVNMHGMNISFSIVFNKYNIDY